VRPRLSGLLLGAALTLLVVAADVGTGSDYAFSLFYLIPIALVTARVGRTAGIAFSLACALGWLAASLATGVDASRPWVLVWNTAMQAAFFSVVAWTFDSVRRGLARERALRDDLARSWHVLDRELTVVGDLQRAMLPAAPPVLAGFRFATYYAASTRAGGDYFDFFPLAGGRLGILIADVSGHGAPAAVVMAMLRVLLHTAPEPLDEPSLVLAGANRRLAANIPPGQFVTACYAVLDPRTGRLEHAIAGHEPPVVLRAAGGPCEPFLHPSGPPLGPFVDASFAGAAVTLAPGDTVLFSTDGLSEAMDPAGVLLGEERVRALLEGARGESVETVRDRLVELVDRHGAGRERADDLTLLVLSREPRYAAPVAAPSQAAR
jgi:sigma-B regulation protein RsbU (phosphoserine phosphatase)